MGLIIFIILTFMFYFSNLKQLNKKIDAIKQAKTKGKETFIDPVTFKEHHIETGEQVIRTEVYSPIGNCITGDRVLKGVKTGRIYRNYSYDKFINHINKQISEGKCWCGERKEFRDNGYGSDDCIKWHIKDKYFYKLETKKEREKIDMFRYKITVWFYKYIYNPATKQYTKQEIGYKEYMELGGAEYISECVKKHME